ncbi:MAG: zinc ABC transporter substrate-binding protein [Candidatus Omnitrophica bacterium]|nr:zinc ABC transporter substrate-binding protein [Candidatus Omnitrophota bacterium]
MKTRVFLIFSLVILFLVSPLPLRAEEMIKIVTTTSDLASIAKEIGKDRIQVNSLSKGTQDPHFIEVRPSMVMKLKDVDLLILIGMDLDIWVQALIDASRNPKISYGRLGYLDASMGIEKLDVLLGKVNASMGHVHPYGNPHYWLDPLNAKIIAGNIAERLSQLSPQNASFFNNNLIKFNKKIDEKMIEWKAKLAPFKGQKIAIYHRSWSYFANRFGLEVACELEPKPGIPPSPGHLKEVIHTIKQQNIKVILMEVFYDEKPARFVAEQTGAKVGIVPNSVGGTKEAKDYFDLIDTIVDKLAKGLEG